MHVGPLPIIDGDLVSNYGTTFYFGHNYVMLNQHIVDFCSRMLGFENKIHKKHNSLGTIQGFY